MSDVLAAAEDLRAFAGTAHELGSATARVAGRVAEYLDCAAEGLTLEEALGLKPGRGEAPWWRAAQTKRRQEAIVRLRDLVSVGGYTSEAAAVQAAAVRYKEGRWRFDSHHSAPPSSNEIRAALHALLSATDGKIPSRRSVERALAECDTK